MGDANNASSLGGINGDLSLLLFEFSGGHVVRTQELADCTNDYDARRLAISLLNSQPKYCGVSVWNADRKIFAEFISNSSQSGVWPLDRVA
jgi:hypothetical protein